MSIAASSDISSRWKSATVCARSGSDGQRSATNTNPPWAVTGFDQCGLTCGADIDHRYVVREPIRRVERFLVAAERDAPRPRAGGDGLHDAISRYINLYYSVAASRRGIDGLSVARDGDADRMVDRPQLDAMQDAARGNVDHVDAAGHFARDV